MRSKGSRFNSDMSKDETKPHVLVVEDARDIREPLARYLR